MMCVILNIYGLQVKLSDYRSVIIAIFNPLNEINPETARTKLGDIIQTLTKR